MKITIKAAGIRTAGQQGREDRKFMAATMKCHLPSVWKHDQTELQAQMTATFSSTLNALENPSAYASRNNMMMLTTKSY